MNVLIVHAHEEPRSFNGAMKNTAIKALEEAGHRVVVSDLYRMNWKAVADGDDFHQRRDKHILKRQMEERAALELGTLSHDILEEQAKLRDCELLILQFPLWWSGLPAILKGWVDRVMSMGFAYGDGHWYDQGGLRGKRAMLALTTGSPAAAFGPRALHGDMDGLLYPIQHGILAFCGFQVLPPFIAWAPAHADDAARAAILERYRNHLARLEELEPLFFHPLADYGEGMQLKPEFDR